MADALSVFRLEAFKQKYVDLGRFAASRLPRNAIFVCDPADRDPYLAGERTPAGLIT